MTRSSGGHTHTTGKNCAYFLVGCPSDLLKKPGVPRDVQVVERKSSGSPQFRAVLVIGLPGLYLQGSSPHGLVSITPCASVAFKVELCY